MRAYHCNNQLKKGVPLMWSKNKRNKYPYLALLVIHTSLLIYTFIKGKKRKGILALLLTDMGFAFLFDYLVVSFFRGYIYQPKILKNKHLDNVLGATLSQALYVPFTAVFITVFQLSWKAKLLFSIYFSLVENLFLKLKLFHKRWWKTWFTFVLIPFYFYISDWRWHLLKNGSKFMKRLCYFNMIHLTWINGIYLLEILSKVRFGFGKVYQWQEQISFVPIYVIVLSTGTTLATLKNNWKRKVLVFMSVVGLDQLLIKFGVLKVKSILPITIVHSISIMMTSIFDKLLDPRNFRQGDEDTPLEKV